MSSKQARYRIVFVSPNSPSEELFGRPVVQDGVLHLIRYAGGSSMGEIEESRVSFPLANVRSYRKIAEY